MSNTFNHVQSSQKLAIGSDDWNGAMDAARALKSEDLEGGATSLRQRDSGTVVIKNNSGSDVVRYGVLGVSSILYTPTDNLVGFKNKPCLVCVTPVEGTHDDKLVILQENIGSGKIGIGMIAGVTPVKININDADHKMAKIKDGDATQLESSDSGYTIVWQEATTGSTWAMIRFVSPVTSSGLFAVNLTKTSGITGSNTLQCTWKYTVKTLDDVTTLGTVMTPDKQRPAVGKVTNGDGLVGLGYYDNAGDFVLYDANEVITAAECVT